MAPKRIEVDMRRERLGFLGLGLLRGWPTEDSTTAAERIEAIRSLVEARAADVRAIELVDAAEGYRLWAPTYGGPNPLIAAEEPLLRRVIAGFPQGLAIDAAAGTGRVARILRDLGHQVLAVEHSHDMISRGISDDRTLKFVRGDLLRLPFRDRAADLITCSLALTHLHDLAVAVSELARVTRRGGVVVLSDLHPFAAATGAHSFVGAIEEDVQAVLLSEVHWPSEYVQAATTAGLHVERCEEVIVDEQMLRDTFGVADLRTDPLASVLGLPFVLLWVLRA